MVRMLLATLLLACCSLCPAQDDSALALPTGVLGANVDELSIAVVLEAEEELNAVRFSVCHDSELADLDSVDETASHDPASFFSADVLEDGFVVEMLWEDTPFPERTATLLEANYTVLEADGDTLDLEFCDDLTDPAAGAELLNVDDESLDVELIDGSILLSEEVTFLRGDVDGNGRVNGILDSLALLRWGFLADDEPPCFEAADVDNDHRISVLLDALWLFTSMFIDGAPPADPGWDFCGPDPDPDGSLGCEDFTGPCPTYKRRP